MTVAHDALGHGTYLPHPRPRTPGMWPIPPCHCYSHLVVITGDLFKLVHLRTYPPQPLLTSSGGHRNTRAVGKRVVRTLRECILVEYEPIMQCIC